MAWMQSEDQSEIEGTSFAQITKGYKWAFFSSVSELAKYAEPLHKAVIPKSLKYSGKPVMFSCSDKTSKTKRLTDDLTAGLVASHSLSGNMSRHRLCSQSTSLPSSRPSSNILKKLPIWIPAVLSFNAMLATQTKLPEHFPRSTSSCRDLWRIG